jgi:pimeloyl-ACP methyl ester carboxylesterase
MPQSESLVLIPSQLCTAAAWRAQIDALAESANTMVADHTCHSTMGGIADKILADAPAQFSLAAHGMGGFIAFEMLRRQPDRIAKLALFDTLATADKPAQTTRREGYAALVREGKFADVVEERIPILFNEAHRTDNRLLDIARQMALDTGAEGFLNQQSAIMGRIDSRPSLPAITCPTLVAIGRDDAITSVNDAREIARLIPHAQLEIIEDSGHLTLLEQPEAVNALLLDWLAAN